MQGDSLPTLAERLTIDFYEWEIRGRGWLRSPYPVDLEPPYRPFLFSSVPATRVTDNAKRPTLLSSFTSRFTSLVRGLDTDDWRVVTDDRASEEVSAEPIDLSECGSALELAVTLPGGSKVGREIAERLLLSLSMTSAPVSFEIVGLAESVSVVVACREADRQVVASQLEAHFPDAVLLETSESLRERWRADLYSFVVDFGLSEEFMRPLAVAANFAPDPLTGVIGTLSNLQEDELGTFQVLFKRVRHSWSESILRSLTAPDGSAFFTDAPEMLPLAREKTSRPLFAAIVRLGFQSANEARVVELSRAAAGALHSFTRPGSNEFIPLTNDGYDLDLHIEDLLERRSHRSGMILNSEELVSLAHLPSESVRIPKLSRDSQKTKSLAAQPSESGIIIGENLHRGKATQVVLPQAERLRHMHVVGATGTGKSTFLLSLILQDIEQGRGVGVIDPHGDLIDELLGRIPPVRFNDVVLFDPADSDYPVGFNVLAAHSELERTLLESDLGALFRRFATSWGDQMSSVLANTVAAFVASERGGTLFDLRRFLADHNFRREFLTTVKDSSVLYYWATEFPILSGRPQSSILTRLDMFLRTKIVRNIVSQKDAKLDLTQVLNGRKIFLAKLAQGLIGEENAYLLGSLLVSKIHQVAIARQNLPEAERRDFFLYIDEFQNFVTPTLASILSGARKYHLGLVLAHQDLHQLKERSSEVLSSVLANAGTRICFRVGDSDAKKLSEGFSSFDARDLQSLGIGEAITRIGRSDQDFNLKTVPCSPIDGETAARNRAAARAASRHRYARTKQEVDAEIEKSFADLVSPAETSRPRLRGQHQESPPQPEPIRAAPEVFPIPPAETTPIQPKPIVEPRVPPTPGRGGAEHKRIQSFFKRFGEDRGFRATIEKELESGGSIDLTLEADEVRIACEVSVSSTSEYELQNTRKCLSAGFSHVVLVSPDPKRIGKLREFVEAGIAEAELRRVRFLSEQELVDFIDELSPKASQKTRGWTVKARRKLLREDEAAARKKVIAEILLRSSKRNRGKE